MMHYCDLNSMMSDHESTANDKYLTFQLSAAVLKYEKLFLIKGGIQLLF